MANEERFPAVVTGKFSDPAQGERAVSALKDLSLGPREYDVFHRRAEEKVSEERLGWLARLRAALGIGKPKEKGKVKPAATTVLVRVDDGRCGQIEDLFRRLGAQEVRVYPSVSMEQIAKRRGWRGENPVLTKL